MYDKKTIIFSKINTDDIPLLQIIEQQAYPNPWSAGIMLDCIKAGYQCLKISPKGQPQTIMAYAFLIIGVDESHLLNITTAPAYIRRGLAEHMLQQLFLISRINYAKTMILEVGSSNQAAMALYRKHGFAVIGERKNYYQYHNASGQKVKEHALVMSRSVFSQKNGYL